MMLGFKVLQSHLRPADQKKCFYCRAIVGSYHDSDCVLINKKIKVRCVIEYEISCPYGWDKEAIEFHRNGGTWCADNMLDELAALGEKEGCLCYSAKYQVIDSVDDKEPFIEVN